MTEDRNFHYEERFACPERLSGDEVTARLAELDPFLEGYFLGLAKAGTEDLVNPMVERLNHALQVDEEKEVSVVSVSIDVLMVNVGGWEGRRLRQAFTDVMTAFLRTRFPTFGGEKRLQRGTR